MDERLGHAYGRSLPVGGRAFVRAADSTRGSSRLCIELLRVDFSGCFVHACRFVLEPIAVFTCAKDPDADGVSAVIDRLQFIIDFAHGLGDFGFDTDHATSALNRRENVAFSSPGGPGIWREWSKSEY